MAYLAKPLLCLVLLTTAIAADPIPIPNFSFEDPPVTRDGINPFGATPRIEDWDERDVGLGDELHQDTGNFINTDPGQPDHITNLHSLRAAFISSLTGNAIRQALPQTFQPGHDYCITIGVGKSYTFPVADSEQLEVALFYFVGNVEHVVASTFVSGMEVHATMLVDVSVTSAVVNEADAWAGRPIGILVRPFLDDPDDDEGEGFWNVDYARLDEILPPDPDSDEDGDVDLRDFAAFQNCFSETEAVSGACVGLDLNSDSVIDLEDLWLFVEGTGGPV